MTIESVWLGVLSVGVLGCSYVCYRMEIARRAFNVSIIAMIRNHQESMRSAVENNRHLIDVLKAFPRTGGSVASAVVEAAIAATDVPKNKNGEPLVFEYAGVPALKIYAGD